MTIGVRDAAIGDVAAALAIYGHHAQHGFGTFDEVPPNLIEFEAKWTDTVRDGLPWLVAVDGGDVLRGPIRTRAIVGGEREAIALALALNADYLIVDDLPARRLATRLGLRITGSAGLLVRARRLGLIDAVRPELDAMIASGLYMSRQVYLEVLGSVGEAGR